MTEWIGFVGLLDTLLGSGGCKLRDAYGQSVARAKHLDWRYSGIFQGFNGACRSNLITLDLKYSAKQTPSCKFILQFCVVKFAVHGRVSSCREQMGSRVRIGSFLALDALGTG